MPAGATIVDVTWAFGHKITPDGKVDTATARLCGRGDKQPVDDPNVPTAAPTPPGYVVKLCFALVALFSMHIAVADVKAAFLNVRMLDEVYVRPSPFLRKFFGVPENFLMRLLRCLYGLRQSSRRWFDFLADVLQAAGLKQSLFEPTLFFSRDGGVFTCVLAHVDDLLIASTALTKLESLLCFLHEKFVPKVTRIVTQYLGMKVEFSERGLKLSMPGYTRAVLREFDMVDAHSVLAPAETEGLVPRGKGERAADQDLYQRLIGALMWLAISVRFDVLQPVCQCARFLSDPSSRHMAAGLRVCRYLKDTADWGLFMPKGGLPCLPGWVDSNYGPLPDRVSVSGILITFGGLAIFAASHKQKCVSTSTSSAEYIAASEICRKVAGMTNLFSEIGVMVPGAVVLHEDNSGAIKSVKKADLGNLRHLDIAHHYVRECIRKGHVVFKQVKSVDNVADIFTKGVKPEVFVPLRARFMSV